MNSADFDRVVRLRVDSIVKTLTYKAKEYASEDRLYNFKRAAEMGRMTPMEAAKGMMLKHIVSVFDLMEGKLGNTEHMVNEKVGDNINYLILLEGLLKEARDAQEAAVSPPCMDCGDCSNGYKS